jgi:hypothetical protein
VFFPAAARTQEKFLYPGGGGKEHRNYFCIPVLGFAGKRWRAGSPAEAKQACNSLLLPLLLLLLLVLLMLLITLGW